MSAAEVKKEEPKTPVAVKPSGPSAGPSPSGSRGGGRGGAGGPMRGGRGGFQRGGHQGGHPYQRGGGRGGGPQRGGGRGGGNHDSRGGNHNRNSMERQNQGGPRGNYERFDRVMDKLAQIQGPTLDLAALDMTEKKFSGRARIYIGNFSNELTEEHLKELVSAQGEIGELFFNREKNFAFVRMGTRFEAEKVKRELDGLMKNGRALKVRFSPHQAAVKVSNLGPWVSNELLHKSFSIFGEIERCLVFVDERGRSKGDGIVEFEKKPSAMECVKRCSDGCFFLTASLRPVIAEIQEEAEDDDGMQEKMLPKRNQEYHTERETGPRFAAPGSFEFEYGSKWKALYDMKKQKLDSLEREMKLEEDKLVAQMEYARYEHETESLREQLRRRESQRDQQKQQWEESERRMDEMMKNEQERRNREEQMMTQRMEEQEQHMRRRQEENSLFMQAQELNQMLDQQEAAMNNGPPQGGFGGPHNGGNNGPWGNSGFGGQNQDDFSGGPMGGNNPFDGGNNGGQGNGGFRGNFRGGFRGGNRGGWGGGGRGGDMQSKRARRY